MITQQGFQDLIEEFFSLVEAVVRLPPGLERRAAFREICRYGERRDARIKAREARHPSNCSIHPERRAA